MALGWDDAVYAGVAAAGAIGNNIANANLNYRTRQFSREMMDKQNAFNVDMWNKSNEYNSYENQRKRMLEAGLNPLGNEFANSAATPMESATPQNFTAPTFDNPISGSLSALATKAQIANLDAQSNKAKAETKTEDQLRSERYEQIKAQNQLTLKNVEGAGLSNQSQEIVNKYLEARESAAAEGAKENVKLSRKQQNYIDYQSKELQYRIEEMLPHELQSLLKNNALLDEKILSEQKNREHIDAVIKEIGATIGKISAETGILEQDLVYYFTNHMSNGFMGTGFSIQNVGKLVDQTITPAVSNFIDKAKEFGSRAQNFLRR